MYIHELDFVSISKRLISITENLLKWLHAQQQNRQLFTCNTHRYAEEILMYICKQGITLDNNIEIPAVGIEGGTDGAAVPISDIQY